MSKHPSIPRVIVLEIPLLIEAKWTDFVDRIWVFQVEPDIAMERVIARNNVSAAEAERRIKSQLPNQERIKFANVVFDTNRKANEVKKEVLAEWEKLLKWASKL